MCLGLCACVCLHHLLCPVIGGLWAVQWCALWPIYPLSTNFTLFPTMLTLPLLHSPPLFSQHAGLLCLQPPHIFQSYTQHYGICSVYCSMTAVLLCHCCHDLLRFKSTAGGASRPQWGRVGSKRPGQSQQGLNDVSFTPVQDLTSHSLPLSVSLLCSICSCWCSVQWG